MGNRKTKEAKKIVWLTDNEGLAIKTEDDDGCFTIRLQVVSFYGERDSVLLQAGSIEGKKRLRKSLEKLWDEIGNIMYKVDAWEPKDDPDEDLLW